MSNYRRRQERKNWRAERRLFTKQLEKQDETIEALHRQISAIQPELYHLKRALGDAEHEQVVGFSGGIGRSSVRRWDAPMPDPKLPPSVELRQLAYAHVVTRELWRWLSDPRFVNEQILERAGRAFVREFINKEFLKPEVRKDRNGIHFSWALWVGRGVPIRQEAFA